MNLPVSLMMFDGVEDKMKTVVPSYYKEFRCIADKCNHSCCKGWEIDIDDETYKKYAESDLPIAK